MLNELMNYGQNVWPALNVMVGVLKKMNLDNGKASMSAYAIEGETDMARKNYCVTLPNGTKVWPSGNTVSDAFNSFAENYGHMFTGKPKEKPVPLLIEYAEQWFSLYHATKAKETTAHNTKILLEKHVYPAVGHMFMDEIRPNDIQRLFNETMYLSESTHKKIKIYLGKIFKNAVEDGIIMKNIMNSDRYVLSKKKNQREALNDAEIKDILRNLNKLTEDERLFMMLVIYTGMRSSEANGLMWTDIDFDKGIIYINRAAPFKGNKPILGNPKSKAGNRMIPLLKPLQEKLEASPRKGEYVLGGDQPMPQHNWKRMWTSIKSKIDVHGATPHVFHHTFATLAEPHVDLKTLQTVMGHSTIQVTMNLYTHPQERNITQAATKLGEAFSL